MKKTIVTIILFAMCLTPCLAQTLKVDETDLHRSGTLNIHVEKAEHCLAMGYKLELPDGIEVTSSGIDNFLAPSHGIWSYESKYVVISEESKPLPTDTGTSLITYGLRATTATPGSYVAKVTNIEFATDRYKLTTLPDVTVRITVADYDNVESIELADESKSIYSISGMKLSQTQKGVNIIRQTDGTVRKVFK